MTETFSNIYSYGSYYTWPAAIADTSHYRTNNQSVTTTSICPAGWSLPKGGDKSNEANNDFWSLIVDGINEGTKPANYASSTQPYYTGTPECSNISNKLRSYPNNFIYSGFFYDSSTSSRGNSGGVGVYWSSTVVDYDGYSHNLIMYSSYVYPGTNNGAKSDGQSVRCVR